jgi:hypothetical protein
MKRTLHTEPVKLQGPFGATVPGCYKIRRLTCPAISIGVNIKDLTESFEKHDRCTTGCHSSITRLAGQLSQPSRGWGFLPTEAMPAGRQPRGFCQNDRVSYLAAFFSASEPWFVPNMADVHIVHALGFDTHMCRRVSLLGPVGHHVTLA